MDGAKTDTREPKKITLMQGRTKFDLSLGRKWLTLTGDFLPLSHWAHSETLVSVRFLTFDFPPKNVQLMKAMHF